MKREGGSYKTWTFLGLSMPFQGFARERRKLRESGGRKSPSESRAKPGRGSGGLRPPEAEAVLLTQCQNSLVKLIYF